MHRRTRGSARGSWTAMLTLCALATALAALPSGAQAQGFGRGGGGNAAVDPSVLWGLPDVRAGFTFCRLMFPAVRNDPSGTGWAIEYPRADMNIMTRFSQLTTATISEWSGGAGGEVVPGHTVVLPTDPELYSCPFVMMSSPATAGFTDEDVGRLRDYMLKGGFLWGDDFWGYASWDFWMGTVRRIFPDFEVVEITPAHALFSVFYRIDEMPQIPSLNRYRSLGGSTSELGEESRTPSMHGVFDRDGRLMLLMTHNTDIADGWEREADLDIYFQRFAWQAYSIGVNVLVYVMTR